MKQFKFFLFILFLLPFIETPEVEASSHKKDYYNDFKKNPYTTKEYRKRIAPYLMDSKHPIKKSLDNIFTKQRVTTDPNTFSAAGFTTLPTNGRSFIYVGKHDSLPGYLVKVCFDSETRKKSHDPSWVWLARRCELSHRIAEVIKRKKCTHFTVAKKWIYPLPLNPPPLDHLNHRKHEILVVTDMQLASREETEEAWKNMTKEHLKQLYTIITLAGGSSYRKDNIPYTKSGKFAFIDTEYPHKTPNYEVITPSLSPEMQEYWHKLIKKDKLL